MNALIFYNCKTCFIFVVIPVKTKSWNNIPCVSFLECDMNFPMMNAPRLLLLLALSFQIAVSSWAVFGSLSWIPATASSTSLKAHADPVIPFTIPGIDQMAHESDSSEIPCELTDSETWDSASDEGLRETLNFNLVTEGNKTVLPCSDLWYSFFRQYSIPPPELL